MLQKLIIRNYITSGGYRLHHLPLSYQVYGEPLGKAPVVLVLHALSGNSSVAGGNGWWKDLIGYGKTIDLNAYTVLCFDIPGNGYNGYLIRDYQEITVQDVSNWFLEGLRQLKISRVFAGIGGSLGGNILWQMAVVHPALFEILIPIATDWKATDWVLSQCRVQKEILNHSSKPIIHARMHAMTFYRSPESFEQKFGRRKDESELFNVENWLFYHGEQLDKRFQLLSYKLMNHLLMTMNIEDFYTRASEIEGKIFLIGISSDGFFQNKEIKKSYQILQNIKQDVFYACIDSIHGHDAFLIEYDQLNEILSGIFKVKIELIKDKNYECTIG